MEGKPLGPCAFCGRQVSSFKSPDGERFGLLHELPMCETFERLDVLEFVRASRARLGITGGSDREN